MLSLEDVLAFNTIYYFKIKLYIISFLLIVLFHTWLAKPKMYDSAASWSTMNAARGWILLSGICGEGGGSLTRSGVKLATQLQVKESKRIS